MSNLFKKDPALYRRMSLPFTSKDEAGDAVREFCQEVRAVREKHKIPDVAMCVGCNYLGEHEGEELVAFLDVHIGDTGNRLPMAAFLFGEAKADQSAQLAEFFEPREDSEETSPTKPEPKKAKRNKAHWDANKPK